MEAAAANADPIRRIRVMATVNLPGLPRGHFALADPRVPYIAGALAGGHLVPAPEARPLPPAVEASEDLR